MIIATPALSQIGPHERSGDAHLPEPGASPKRAALRMHAHPGRTLAVADGDTLGVRRREDGAHPDIALPAVAFPFTSQIQGRFLRDEAGWTYEHRGKNRSCVIRPDGSQVSLARAGDCADLPSGAIIRLAGSSESLDFSESPVTISHHLGADKLTINVTLGDARLCRGAVLGRPRTVLEGKPQARGKA